MESLKGRLLVSAGSLYDPNFRQSVVLIAEHGTWGAVGVILNRPLETTVRAAVPALADLAGADTPLFEGGPVEPDQAVLLVEAAEPELLDVPVFGSVGFLTGDVPSEAQNGVLRARVFLGHAGWGPGQLESELKSRAWLIEAAHIEDIFTTDPPSLWRRVLQRKGPPYDGLARLPYDPRTN